MSLLLSAFGIEFAFMKTLSIVGLILAFLTSCWCNVLLIRGGYIGKSSLVIWVIVSILGVPPIGFFLMLFLLSRSIKNIEVTGKT
ncbi:hypothetical protein LP420_24955 [Massilia sp. B-10]|nr:hypothetical protein LP420_24955 [Massilia sp. B-10]UUZ52546.1 hypothetical protein LP419_24465 [Massilia sp. H-1]